MQRPKIVVIGAGSYFFGRPVIWNMTHSEVLRPGTLALVDRNPDVLDTFMRLAKRTIEATKAPTQLEGFTDWREALTGADFVVTSFSNRGNYYRGMDAEIALKHGVRLCSADTIGPGAIFRTCRELPEIIEIAHEMQRAVPDAWLVNFVNPTAVIGIGLQKYAPNIRSFALCDALHLPYLDLRVLKTVGILPDDAQIVPPEIRQKLVVRIAGVNHFTWMFKLEYDGKDYLPKYREQVTVGVQKEKERLDAALFEKTDLTGASKRRYSAAYALRLLDIFKAYPNRIVHTKEYVPWFQGYGKAPVQPEPITIFDASERQAKVDEFHEETLAWADGAKPIEEFIKNGGPDHATDIIESMWGGLGKPFFINTPNHGAVTNLPDDAFLESRCDVDMNGPRPMPIGPMPLGLRGLTQQVLDTHELTAKAAMEFDRNALLQAMIVDPIVNNIEDAEAIIEETFARQKDALDPKWYE